MKALTTDHIAPNLRCAHRFPASGHQCRLLASDSKSGLCAQHLAKKKNLDRDADFFFPLMKRDNRFQTAQEINYSLNHLYDLLACDRISARRAATLAYISSLLLRTLPTTTKPSAFAITNPAPAPATHPRTAKSLPPIRRHRPTQSLHKMSLRKMQSQRPNQTLRPT